MFSRWRCLSGGRHCSRGPGASLSHAHTFQITRSLPFPSKCPLEPWAAFPHSLYRGVSVLGRLSPLGHRPPARSPENAVGLPWNPGGRGTETLQCHLPVGLGRAGGQRLKPLAVEGRGRRGDVKVPGLDCDVSGPGGQELVLRPRQLESVGGRLVSLGLRELGSRRLRLCVRLGSGWTGGCLRTREQVPGPRTARRPDASPGGQAAREAGPAGGASLAALCCGPEKPSCFLLPAIPGS